MKYLFSPSLQAQTLNDRSAVFDLKRQITVVGLGYEPLQATTFELVLLSEFVPDPCACPPGKVVLPGVAAAAPLTCCGTVIQLDADHPFVIIDAPIGAKLRAVQHNGPGPTVYYTETDTRDVNDRLRGCQCDGVPQ